VDIGNKSSDRNRRDKIKVVEYYIQRWKIERFILRWADLPLGSHSVIAALHISNDNRTFTVTFGAPVSLYNTANGRSFIFITRLSPEFTKSPEKSKKSVNAADDEWLKIRIPVASDDGEIEM